MKSNMRPPLKRMKKHLEASTSHSNKGSSQKKKRISTEQGNAILDRVSLITHNETSRTRYLFLENKKIVFATPLSKDLSKFYNETLHFPELIQMFERISWYGLIDISKCPRMYREYILQCIANMSIPTIDDELETWSFITKVGGFNIEIEESALNIALNLDSTGIRTTNYSLNDYCDDKKLTPDEISMDLYGRPNIFDSYGPLPQTYHLRRKPAIVMNILNYNIFSTLNTADMNIQKCIVLHCVLTGRHIDFADIFFNSMLRISPNKNHRSVKTISFGNILTIMILQHIELRNNASSLNATFLKCYTQQRLRNIGRKRKEGEISAEESSTSSSEENIVPTMQQEEFMNDFKEIQNNTTDLKTNFRVLDVQVKGMLEKMNNISDKLEWSFVETEVEKIVKDVEILKDNQAVFEKKCFHKLDTILGMLRSTFPHTSNIAAFPLYTPTPICESTPSSPLYQFPTQQRSEEKITQDEDEPVTRMEEF